MQTNIPIAIGVLAGFWENTLKPALETVWSFIQNNIIPIFVTVAQWLQTNIPIAIGVLAGFWENTLKPALETVWSFIQNSIIPTFETVAVAEGYDSPALRIWHGSGRRH
ncbi:MAG: hypothetical protein IPK78_18125 [Rhodospirillales bacterium]|nr:hypothetical protein [Rhodospirillales bacterium]